MNNKKILIAALIVVALAQLIIPFRMIKNHEARIITGEEYKFRVISSPENREQPINIRRGLFYVNEIILTSGQNFSRGETVYVGLKTGPDGFAEAVSVSRVKEEITSPFLRAKVNFIFAEYLNKILVIYPFEKDYNNETNSSEFSAAYREALKNQSNIYALVYIKNGNAILKDIFIDGTPLREYSQNKTPVRN